MPLSPPSIRAKTCALALAGAVVALGAAGIATAEPERSAASVTKVAAARTAPAVSVGSVDASVDASTPAIPSGEPFGFTTRVRVNEPVSFLQVRLQVFRPSGRLIFQRTRIENTLKPGTREFHFERTTSDLGLQPGTYPAEVQVTVQGPGGRVEDVIATELRVYDPAKPPTDIVMVAHVTGWPTAGPNGRFSEDPGNSMASLNELESIVSAAVEDDLRVTVSVAPMLLEEWKRIAAGYEVQTADGVKEIPATEATPKRFASVLDQLAAAMRSGRVELLSTGYSDPDLSELAANGLGTDAGVQYRQGLSAAFASLESTPSTGTAPAGAAVPPSVAPQLAAEDVGFVIVSPRSVRRGDATVTAGVYESTESQLAVLVTDDTAGLAAAEGDERQVLVSAFSRHAAKSKAPFVFIANVGPAGDGTAEGFVRAARRLSTLPWLEPRLAREVAKAGGSQAQLVSAAPDRNAPKGYWADVISGRRWANALTESAGDARRDTMAARAASLIAESAAWAHDEWALASRGRDYADAAVAAGRRALDPVRLSLQPITLAGSDGAVPVTISNGTNTPLTVRVTSAAGGNLRIVDGGSQELRLQPKENFFEVPVTLQNAVSGRLTVSVFAGDVVLERKTVTVRASYLDRLALIGGIVVALGGLLAYIIRRVSRAEAGDRVSRRDGRYTDSTQEPPGSDA